ncbi:hypothetical protein GCM10007902_04540 [Dyella nitratireducens]|nr:hypothetical protein GCM10007902_04540 [Dyella nitratireducens]
MRNRKQWNISDAQASGGVPLEVEIEESTRSLLIESAPGLWAIRLNDPCGQIPGRQWRVELVLVDMNDGNGPAFGCSLSVLVPSGIDEVLVTPGIPAVVGMLAKSHGLSDGGFKLDGTVWEVDRPADVDRLIAFIETPARMVPVVAVSVPRNDGSFVEPAEIARALAGLALVVTLSADAAQEVTARYGRALGVFGNAVRMYRVGFDPDVDAWHRHPLYVASSWERRIRAVTKILQFDAMADSVSVRDENRDIPSFSVIRRIASEQRIQAALKNRQTDAEAFEELAAAVSRFQAQADEWQRMALDEEESAKQAVQAQRETKIRLYQLGARIEALEAQLRECGGNSREANPTSFEDLREWAARQLSGRLVITPKAERAALHSPHEDVSHVYDCLYFLGTTYRDLKRGVGDKALYDQEMAQLGIRISKTGKAVDTARFEDEYSVVWEGYRYKLDMHLAGSDSFDPRYTLRIYYAWDAEQQLIVVGHLPTHLTNALS